MPVYRSTGQRRSGRVHVDHDVFEGLPVRQWRKEVVNITTSKNDGSNSGGLKGHGGAVLADMMPRDAHMLSPMSQAILRAARAGNKLSSAVSYSAAVAAGGSEAELGAGAGIGNGEDDVILTTVRWQLVPRHLEGPEVNYLAKRHNVVVVDGDDKGESIALAAPGATSDGAGGGAGGSSAYDMGQLAPSRKRPPPPRRKPKGAGRGRRKKVHFSDRPGNNGAMDVGGDGAGDSAQLLLQQSAGHLDEQFQDNEGPDAAGDGAAEDSAISLDAGEVAEAEKGAAGDDEDGEVEDEEREEGELSPSPDEEADERGHSVRVSPPTVISTPSAPIAPVVLVPPVPPVDPALPPAAKKPMPATPSVIRPTQLAPLAPVPHIHQPQQQPQQQPLLPSLPASASRLHLNPTGLTHPLPPKPEPSIFRPKSGVPGHPPGMGPRHAL